MGTIDTVVVLRGGARHFAITAAALSAFAVAGVAQAQDVRYPTKPIRYVVGATPGGSTDVLARAIGQKLTELWGQQVVVDNRAGASGIVGSDIVAKAVPDGHSLLMAYTSHVTNPSLYQKMPYDTVRDFAPVTMIATVSNVVVVHPGVPVRSVDELVALARAKPGTLSFGSAGNGTSTHLAGVLFAMMTNTKLIHVPYRGATPALADLIGGQTTMYFGNLVSTYPHVRSGRLRALATTGAKRAGAAPDLPTLAESGLTGYDAVAWFATFTTANVPAAVVDRLNREIVRIVNAPDMKEKLAIQGADAAPSTPAQLGGYVKSELERWAKVIRESGAKAD
jgi:tripartite-type tricarboxylate transporter receptor subunit TctC